MRFLFIVTIFLGSGLLFLVQPMAAKMILPRFGGSPAVWTTSMLLFQALLLAGYWLAHRIGRFGFIKITAIALASSLALAFGVSRYRVADYATGFTVVDVLVVLSVLVGLPFLVLSMCSPTIQGLFASTRDERAANPYFLYAAGNVGSFLALVSYPFVVEPNLTLRQQFDLFKGGLLLLVVLFLLCSRFVSPIPKNAARSGNSVVTNSQRFTWLLLAAVPSSLMLGFTAFATTNVAPVPLFWVAPLAVYLLTFVIAFSENNPFPSSVWARILPLAVTPLAMIMILESSEPIGVMLAIHGIAFTVAALMCHTRLSETKPSAEKLTEFYLWLAIGGAVGGFFNAIVAPTVFATIAEYPIAVVAALVLRPASGDQSLRRDLLIGTAMLFATASIAFAARMLELPATPMRTALVIGAPVIVCFLFSNRVYRFAFAIGAVFLATHLTQVGTDDRILLADRSFFGVHRVLASEDNRFHLLTHGTTVHGIQDSNNPATPLAYYTAGGPVGEVFTRYEFGDVGLVGLGVGSCAAYGARGQNMTFFEIDPIVIDIAKNPMLFTFIRDSEADVEIVKGDARLTLDKREDGEFDLLVLDAFSSDAIPMHLLTREAFRLYLRKTAPNGIIALHISNRVLDLEPIVAKIAESLGITALALESAPNQRQYDAGMRPSIWMVIVRDPAHASKLIGWRPAESLPDTPLWTDDYSNILSAYSTD